MSSTTVTDMKELTRDCTLLGKVTKLLSDMEVNKKLRAGECLILRECIEHCCPYPTYLVEKLSRVCGDTDAASILSQEWSSFEKVLVNWLLNSRGTAKAIVNRLLDEGLAAKNLKSVEALTIRNFFEDGGAYPDFVLSKLSESHKAFLLNERELYFECQSLLTRFIADVSNLAALGKLSSDEFQSLISSISTAENGYSNEGLHPAFLSENEALYLKAKQCLFSYVQLVAKEEAKHSTAADKSNIEYLMAAVKEVLDKSLKEGKLRKVEHQTILVYLDDGEDIPETLLSLLQASDRSVINSAVAAAKKKTTSGEAEEKVSRVLTPSPSVSIAEGGMIVGEKRVDDATIPFMAARANAVKLPFDNIFIFHDAENCPLPKKTFKRNAAGEKVLVDGKPQFMHSHPPGLGDICFAKVYAGIIKTTLRCALLGSGADPANVEKLLLNLDVNRQLQVTYHFLFSGEPSNPFFPPNGVVTGMITKGVNVMTADRKKGSVDGKITELMNTELDKARNYTEESLAKTLFVLISGDRDFAHTVKRVRKGQIEVVVITSKDCPVNQAFLSELNSPLWAANNWLEIVESSQRLDDAEAVTFGKLSPDRKAMGGGKLTEVLSTSPGKPSSLSLPANDDNLVCSVGIESLHKAWFVKNYGITRLNEALNAIDANLKAEVETRREIGLKVRVLLVSDESKAGEAVQASLGPVNTDSVSAAVKAVLDSVEYCGPVFLPGVSPASLKWQSPEGREIVSMQRSLRVSLFVPQQSGPDAKALKDDELVVEHPSNWSYHTLWQYCAKEVGVPMDTTYKPEPDDALQKGARPGKRRSKVRIYGKSSKPENLVEMKRQCFNHQVPDSLVFFVLGPKEAKTFISKAPKQVSSLPSMEGWQVSSYHNEAASAILSYFKGEEDKMKDMLQLLSIRTKVVATCSIKGAAQVLLIQRQFASLREQLESRGINSSDIVMKWPAFPNLRAKVDAAKDIPPIIAAELSLTGHPESVEKAMSLWNDKMRLMNVQSINIPQKIASQFGLIGELSWNIKKSLQGSRRQKEVSNAEGKGGEDVNEDDDDDDDCSTAGSTTSTVA
eukprot:gene29730-35895_t